MGSGQYPRDIRVQTRERRSTLTATAFRGQGHAAAGHHDLVSGCSNSIVCRAESRSRACWTDLMGGVASTSATYMVRLLAAALSSRTIDVKG